MTILKGLRNKWLRWLVILLVSPIIMVTCLFLLLVGMSYFEKYRYEQRFENPKKLSRLTGIEIPDYDVVEFNENGWISHHKLNDCLHAKFSTIPTSKFYSALDSLVMVENCNWHSDNEKVFVFVNNTQRVKLHILRGLEDLYIYYGGDEMFWE